MADLKVIEIDDNGSFVKPKNKIFYVPKGAHCMFRYSGQRLHHSIPVLVTNFAKSGNKKTVWDDSDSDQLTMNQLSEKYNLVQGEFKMLVSWSSEIVFEESGVFFFRVLFLKKKQIDNQEPLHVKPGNHIEDVIVNPEFQNTSKDDAKVTFDGVTLMSIFPTMMGKFETWESELDTLITKRGYRGFHFPPIQKLGASNSLYSVNDFTAPNPEFFKVN